MNLEIQILMLYLSNGEYNYGQFGWKHYCHSYIKVMKDANYSDRTGLITQDKFAPSGRIQIHFKS